VLVLTKSPYARRSIEAARIAKDAGARVIAITDGVHSPIIPLAGVSFIVSTDSPNFFPSHAATLVLFEALLGMVVRRRGKSAQARIAAVESVNRSHGEYWQR
jgi:DNA-binding MurR/RpiR family transcriptional regulator